MGFESYLVKICTVLGIGPGDVIAIATVAVGVYAWTIGGALADAKSNRRRKPSAKSMVLLARLFVLVAVAFLIIWVVLVFSDLAAERGYSQFAFFFQIGTALLIVAAVLWVVQLFMIDENSVSISSYTSEDLERLKKEIVSRVMSGGVSEEEALDIASAAICNALATEALELNKAMYSARHRESAY